MKKYLKVILVIVALILVTLGIYLLHEHNYSKVTIYTTENNKLQIMDVKNGKTINTKNLKTPSYEGHVLIGWYDLDTLEDFDVDKDVITKDTVLVAKWATLDTD